MADIRPPTEVTQPRGHSIGGGASVIVNPSQSVQALPPGSTIQGQVLGRTPQGQIQVQLPDGQTLQLQTPLPLTAGRAVTLVIQQTGTPGLVQVQIQATGTAQTLPIPNTVPADGNPGLRPLPLPLAQNIAAIFIPAELRRTTGAGGANSPTIGKVLSQQGGTTEIETAFGRIQVPNAPTLKPGAMVSLSFPQQPDAKIQISPLGNPLPGEAKIPASNLLAAQNAYAEEAKPETRQIPITLFPAQQKPATPAQMAEVVFVSPQHHVTLKTANGVFTLLGNYQAKAGDQFWLAMPESATASPTAAAVADPLRKTLAHLPQLQDLWNKQPSLALQNFLQQIIPQPGPKLPAQILLYLAAISGNEGKFWFGPKLLQELESRKDKLGQGLLADFEAIEQEDSKGTQPWRHIPLPILDGQQMQFVQFFCRRQQTQDGAEIGQRFVIEANLSKLGALQLDGFVRAQSCQLVLRGQRELPANLQADIRQIFQDYMDLSGFEGSIRFQTTPEFPIHPAKDNGLGQRVNV